jgi:Zn-dependent protease
MPVRGQLTLVRIKGIRIGVDYSWFLVLFLLIWYLSDVFRDLLGAEQADSEPYLLAVLTSLGFFASILLHELGHALVAIRRGIPISDITLWLFGGVARMTKDTDSPGTEFKISIAGPLVTLALALGCAGIGIAISGASEFSEALDPGPGDQVSGVLGALYWLATMNAIVFVFNLIPALPLDGGRVVRALAWRMTGDRNRATRFAALLGQGFSYLFMFGGLLLLVGGNAFTGIWLAVIGFILGQSARGQAIQSEFAQRIEGITVSDVMDAEPVAIPEDATVQRAMDEYFLRYRWPWFPVVDAAQRFRGLLVREAADAVPEPVRSQQRVGDVFETDASGTLRVRDDEPLESLLGNDALRRLGGLAAVDADGLLRGVITADQVGRALRDALAPLGGAGPGGADEDRSRP